MSGLDSVLKNLQREPVQPITIGWSEGTKSYDVTKNPPPYNNVEQLNDQTFFNRGDCITPNGNIVSFSQALKAALSRGFRGEQLKKLMRDAFGDEEFQRFSPMVNDVEQRMIVVLKAAEEARKQENIMLAAADLIQQAHDETVISSETPLVNPDNTTLIFSVEASRPRDDFMINISNTPRHDDFTVTAQNNVNVDMVYESCGNIAVAGTPSPLIVDEQPTHKTDDAFDQKTNNIELDVPVKQEGLNIVLEGDMNVGL